MVCGNFILPEPASYVFFYAVFNLRKLLYIVFSNQDFVNGSVIVHYPSRICGMCCGYQGKRSITAWDKRQPRNLVRDPSVHWCLLSVPCGYWALTVFLRGFVLRLLCSSCAVTKRYWCPAEIAPKGPAGKTNCGSKEKAITEFFQILYTEQWPNNPVERNDTQTLIVSS